MPRHLASALQGVDHDVVLPNAFFRTTTSFWGDHSSKEDFFRWRAEQSEPIPADEGQVGGVPSELPNYDPKGVMGGLKALMGKAKDAAPSPKVDDDGGGADGPEPEMPKPPIGDEEEPPGLHLEDDDTQGFPAG